MSTAAITRLHRHRQRQREGKVVLSVEVDLLDHCALLEAADLLKQWDDHDRAKIEEATSRFLRAAARERETRF